MADNEQPADLDYAPSKSELKRRMHALQALGETLVTLSERELKKIPIEDDTLREAIYEARAIRSNSARKRHLQFIGKLMRNIDPEPIGKALEELHASRQQDADEFHTLEALRDRVLAEGDEGVQEVLTRWPAADRQQLRQLVRQHKRERDNDKPPAASRRLFRYLRELHENYGAEG